jgi:hypothetical protein
MSAKHRFPIQRRLIMFEKIGRFAETLAISTGQSRRGFLGHLGKGALGVAGVVGGLLLFQGDASAANCTGGCTYFCPALGFHVTRECLSGCTCEQTIQHKGTTCSLSHFGCRAK